MSTLFVTGMLRSGTSLAQVLLTNHPQLFVAYQPYHQLYVQVRQKFLDEYGIKKFLPLGDGLDSTDEEIKQFTLWFKERKFDAMETADLVNGAATGKGGSAHGITDGVMLEPGTFFEIQSQLHRLVSIRYKKDVALHIGAKEVLCEEYVPAIIEAGARCIIIVRDPRAVIASACHGRYLSEVGDRYPILMLLRLWRKSAAYLLALKDHPLVHAIRYEDLIQNSDDTLNKIACWLGIEPFPEGLINQPLHAHTGDEWKGNSSFGDKVGIDSSSREAWRTVLSREEIRFIEACTHPELSLLGYSFNENLRHEDIFGFIETESGVRAAYLSNYGLTQENKEFELQRWDVFINQQFGEMGSKRLFLFPSVFTQS